MNIVIYGIFGGHISSEISHPSSSQRSLCDQIVKSQSWSRINLKEDALIAKRLCKDCIKKLNNKNRYVG